MYERGEQTPIFTVGDVKFGIIIRNDSNFIEPTRTIVAKRLVALFVPTKNGMPENRGGVDLVSAPLLSQALLVTEINVGSRKLDRY